MAPTFEAYTKYEIIYRTEHELCSMPDNNGEAFFPGKTQIKTVWICYSGRSSTTTSKIQTQIQTSYISPRRSWCSSSTPIRLTKDIKHCQIRSSYFQDTSSFSQTFTITSQIPSPYQDLAIYWDQRIDGIQQSKGIAIFYDIGFSSKVFVKFMIHSLQTNTLTVSVTAWEQEAYLCTSKFGITGHVGVSSIQPSLLKLHYPSFWITSTLQTSSRRRTRNLQEQGWLHTSKPSAGFRSNLTFQYLYIFKAKLFLIFSNQRLVFHSKDPKLHRYHWQS